MLSAEKAEPAEVPVVLVIEDNDADADFVTNALVTNESAARIVRVSRLAEGIARLSSGKVDIILLDLSLPDAYGLGGLRRIRTAAPAIPVIVLTGRQDAGLSAQAVRDGAQEYLVKGEADPESFARKIRHALERAKEESRRAAAEETQRRASWLADAVKWLFSSLDYDATLDNIARAAVPSFADSCSSRVAGTLQIGGRKGVRESGQEAKLIETLRTGRSWFDPDGASDVLVVPMVIAERVVGAIALTRNGSNRRYSRTDLELAEELGRRAALAVENALLYREARAASALRDEFISSATDELRTALSPLQLQLRPQRKGESLRSREELEDGLAKCRGQTARLSRLVETLLDASLIATGQLALNRVPLELGTVVRETITRFVAESPVGGDRLIFDSGAPVLGRWDRLRIEQVVTNLISNGLKYGGTAPVHVTVGADQTHAWLSVRDNGIRILASDLLRTFDRFERAGHYHGLGLGLYVTRKIVEAHGGQVAVESEPGTGSIFTVRVPLSPPAPPAPVIAG